MNLNQVTVPSLDVEKSIDFYSRLGLILIVKALPHYARFLCTEGDASFSVHLVDQLPTGETAMIYFEITDLDEKVASLKSLGFEFYEDPADKPWLWREARLRDPDQNAIVLYYAGENRLNPPWRI